MATFKPAHHKKNNCIDHQVTNAIFECFQTTGLYNNKTVDVTIDQETVMFKDGDYEIGGIETVICFKSCQVPKPCSEDSVIVCGVEYRITKQLHNDGVCVCVTVNNCGVC